MKHCSQATFVPFEASLQTSPILSFIGADFDGDKQTEVLAAGNYFGVKPYHGRFDGFSGALIKNNNNISLGYTLGLNLHNKSVRHLDVLNAFDKCPYTPGPAENQGCPLDGDRDQDGITDRNDQCPDEYGLAIHGGCPFEDADGDLVANDKDECPFTPGDPSNNGCPKASDAEEAILELAIQNLYFDTNKSLIQKESFESLNNLAELLVQQPTYRIRIEGHTDSIGDAAFNYELSKNRAFSVQNYLVNSGVSEDQLIVEYYGETKPVVSNMTADKRKLNRRVEMTFVWK